MNLLLGFEPATTASNIKLLIGLQPGSFHIHTFYFWNILQTNTFRKKEQCEINKSVNDSYVFIYEHLFTPYRFNPRMEPMSKIYLWLASNIFFTEVPTDCVNLFQDTLSFSYFLGCAMSP